MSDELVTVPFGEDASDTATLLLDAAEKKGYGPEVVTVRHTSDGNAFEVPKDVASAAKVDTADEPLSLEDQVKADEKRLAGYLETSGSEKPGEGRTVADDQEDDEKAAKRTPAKKAAAKKTANK